MARWRSEQALNAPVGVGEIGFENAHIIERFTWQARATPAAVAIVENGVRTTYAALDARSNQLARHLIGEGVGEGCVVALVLNRSAAALIAILAILKAGAVYAPLDPATPVASLDWIVADCGARLTLTDKACAPLQAPSRDLAHALAASTRQSSLPLAPTGEGGDIAYVMYTSGSSGRPKGVSIPHRGVARLVSGQTYMRFGPEEIFLHAAPLAFDASTLEIWGALLHGGTLVVIPQERPSLHELIEAINTHGVTTAWFTAGLFHLLVEKKLDSLAGLRQIIAGGDVLSPSHVMAALKALPDCQLINGYGPTENTTFTCCYPIPREGWGGGPTPIGTPINHTYVRILDEAMRPVGDGEIGMLYAGGLGLACGYVGHARHTTAFVPDPLSADGRLYRTGDLARRRSDGQLDFLGRRDRQIKVDGKRVELGEIEEVLRRNRAIADALVVMTANGLSAYVKPAFADHDHAQLIAAARINLERALPAHMRPANINVVAEFALTANGKIDQRRLPAAQPLTQAATTGAAANELETALSSIFSRALGVAEIDCDTNFFDLGATSLQLLEAHVGIEERWGGLSILALFAQPNIRALACLLAAPVPAPAPHPAQKRAQAQRAAIRRLRSPKLAQ